MPSSASLYLSDRILFLLSFTYYSYYSEEELKYVSEGAATN